MRIGEVARRSGVPVPTLKYYIRAGLLPGGEVSAPNQAVYDESHLRRLRLIRALLGVGGLSVLAAHELLRAIDDTGTADDPLRAAGRALASRRQPADARVPVVEVRVDALVRRHAWRVPAGSDALEDLADVLASLSALGLDPTDQTLDAYIAAATGVARCDRDTMRATGGTREAIAAGAVLNEALLAVLHRLAVLALIPDRRDG